MNLPNQGDDHQTHEDAVSAPAQLALDVELTVAMSSPCPDCGCSSGTIVTDNGRDQVRCNRCGRVCYHLPSTETARPHRTLRTRPAVKVSQRVRVLLRDGCACVLCHRRGVPLEVGHLISVRDGLRLGLSDAYLFGDENLAAMCRSCNSGLGSDTVPLRFLLPALRARR
jgi:5-methylcytosine-specific restriction endonuclease McrA